MTTTTQSRRSLVGIVVTVIVLVVLVGGVWYWMSTQAAPQDESVVETDTGSVQGMVTDTVRIFNGIPYAAPPVGDLRWASPQPATAWTETRATTEFGNPCPQTDADMIGNKGSTTEDCLYLNVTTPRIHSGDAARPVLVWVHGGGFQGGAGSDNDPTRMVTTGDIIVVTINYRLGIFGFYGYPGLEGSGTFALQDQQAALQWVQRNAAAFGGDPNNVTVMGESAGADSMCGLMASPSAAGLYDRMIIQTGSCTHLNVTDAIIPGAGVIGETWKPLATEEATGAAVAAGQGCDDAATAVECMRGKTVEELMAIATTPDGMPIVWSPAYGGATLPAHPGDVLDNATFPKVPMMAGVTRNEGRYFAAAFFEAPGQALNADAYAYFTGTAFGENVEAVNDLYPSESAESLTALWGDIITDRAYACPMTVSSGQFAAHTPTYVFEFADENAPVVFPLQVSFPLGAYHASEVAYLLDSPTASVTFTPEQQQLSDTMIRYWTNFAKNGDPNGEGLPEWKVYNGTEAVPYIQSLAPGDGGIQGVDFNIQHHCDFWVGLN